MSMNRGALLLLLILALPASIQSKPASLETVVFAEDFESYAPGAPPSPPWDIHIPDNSWYNDDVRVVDNVSVSGTRSLEISGIYGYPTGSASASRRFTLTGDVVGYELFVYISPTAGSQADRTFLIIGLKGGLDSLYARVLFEGDYRIVAAGRRGLVYIGSFLPHKWYKIKVIFDLRDDKFDVWLDDNLVASGIEEYPVGNVYSFSVGTTRNWHKCFVDDVRVFELSEGGASKPSIVLGNPVIDCRTVFISGNATVEGSTIERIHWDWGDGSEEDAWFPASHTYEEDGVYTIAVTAFAASGQEATETIEVTISCESRLEGDIWSDRGGIGSTPSCGTYALGEDISIHFQLNQNSTVKIVDELPNGTVKVLWEGDAEGGRTYTLHGRAGEPLGPRRLKLVGSNGETIDSCTLNVSQLQPARCSLQITSVDFVQNDTPVTALHVGETFGVRAKVKNVGSSSLCYGPSFLEVRWSPQDSVEEHILLCGVPPQQLLPGEEGEAYYCGYLKALKPGNVTFIVSVSGYLGHSPEEGGTCISEHQEQPAEGTCSARREVVIEIREAHAPQTEVHLVSPKDGAVVRSLPVELVARVTVSGEPVEGVPVQLICSNGGTSFCHPLDGKKTHYTDSDGYVRVWAFSMLEEGSTVEWYAEATYGGERIRSQETWNFVYSPLSDFVKFRGRVLRASDRYDIEVSLTDVLSDPQGKLRRGDVVHVDVACDQNCDVDWPLQEGDIVEVYARHYEYDFEWGKNYSLGVWVYSRDSPHDGYVRKLSEEGQLEIHLVSPNNGSVVNSLPVTLVARVTINGEPAEGIPVKLVCTDGGTSFCHPLDGKQIHSSDPDGYIRVQAFSQLAEGSAVRWYAVALHGEKEIRSPETWIFTYRRAASGNDADFLRETRKVLEVYRRMYDPDFWHSLSEKHKEDATEIAQELLLDPLENSITDIPEKYLSTFAPAIVEAYGLYSLTEKLIKSMRIVVDMVISLELEHRAAVASICGLKSDVDELVNTVDDALGALERGDINAYERALRDLSDRLKKVEGSIRICEGHLLNTGNLCELPQNYWIFRLNGAFNRLLNTTYSFSTYRTRGKPEFLKGGVYNIPGTLVVSDVKWIVNGKESDSASPGDEVTAVVTLEPEPLRSFEASEVEVKVLLHHSLSLLGDEVVSNSTLQNVKIKKGESIKEEMRFKVEKKLFAKSYVVLVSYKGSYLYAQCPIERPLSAVGSPELEYKSSGRAGTAFILRERSSELHILVKDREGRRVGYENGVIYREIQGSDYIVLNGSVMALVPEIGSFSLRVDSSKAHQEVERFELTVVKVDGDTKLNATISDVIGKGGMMEYAVDTEKGVTLRKVSGLSPFMRAYLKATLIVTPLLLLVPVLLLWAVELSGRRR